MLVTHRFTRVLACMAGGSFYHGAGQSIPPHFGQGIPVPYHASWLRCYNCVVTWNAIPVRHPTYYSSIHISIHKTAIIHENVSDHSLDVLILSDISTCRICTEWSDVARDDFPFILTSAHRRPITVVVVDWLSYTRTAFNQFSSTISCLRHSSFKCSCESRRGDPASLSWTFIIHPTDHSRRSMTSFKASYQPSRLLICDDLDTPVADDGSISPGLDDVLETLGLEQHVRSPIRNDPDHLLDLIITDQPSNIRDVQVIDSGLVWDHQLILASVDITSSADFESTLRQSSLQLSSPAKDADSFTDQINSYRNTCVILSSTLT